MDEKLFKCFKCNRTEREIEIGAFGYCNYCIIEIDNRNIKEAIKNMAEDKLK